jgi:hypothetical protein
VNSSGSIAAVSLAAAIALTGTTWWFVPVFPWWVYLIFALFAYAGICGAATQQAANETIIDRGDWPNKEPPNQ